VIFVVPCIDGRVVVCTGAHPPQVKEQYPATLVVQLGSSVRIACPVYGAPRPLVSWSKDSRSVHLGWQRFHTQRGGTWLHITGVQLSDAGRYTCDATNGFGTASVTIHLHVVCAFSVDSYSLH